MKYAFYITNHGFGHASRNVPIIRRLLELDTDSRFFIKSDRARCDFIKRNLPDLSDIIEYYDDCTENGLILKEGSMTPDVQAMEATISEDFTRWDEYIQREVTFMNQFKPDIVVADVVCWAIKAAHICGIKSLLIGNFSWAQMYKSFFDETIWGPYEECYSMADKALWYEIHEDELHHYCDDYECVSMVSRAVNQEEVQRIRARHSRPLVFVSLGASAEIEDAIDVSGLPYDFAVTRGITLSGDNVEVLPMDMINTPDYIAASEYVIAKGGWSTVAEILLQRKKCALLYRGNNPEDNNTRRILSKRNHCVGLNGDELKDIGGLIDKISRLEPSSYDNYWDDKNKICDIIRYMILG